jgi:hypothetical protein
MIELRFSLSNPYSTRFISTSNFYKSITKNKTVEIQTFKTNHILALELSFRHRESHAGLEIWFGFFGYTIKAQIRDNRHWDYFNKCWEKNDNTDSKTDN